jgi:hypothetical protein
MRRMALITYWKTWIFIYSTMYLSLPPLPLMLSERMTWPRCSCFYVKISNIMQWIKGSDSFFSTSDVLKSVKEWLVVCYWAEICFIYGIIKSYGMLLALMFKKILLMSFPLISFAIFCDRLYEWLLILVNYLYESWLLLIDFYFIF